MIDKILLELYYVDKKMSMSEMANKLDCSVHKISYWMKKYDIKRRSRSDANYELYSRNRKKFHFKKPETEEEWRLYGIGLGLYWGEGNKANRNSVRLGNTDINIIKSFLSFLIKFYNIDESRLRFGVQIFNDIRVDDAIKYWSEGLDYKKSHFMKPVITNQNRKGLYKKKSKYGVLTVYYHDTKLRNALVDELPSNGVKYTS